MKIRWKAAAAAAAASLALAGCAGTDGGDGGDRTLTTGMILAPATLDPAASEWGNRAMYYQAAYDTLLRATAEGTIEPWLATGWEYDDDATELTLTLRDDVTFTDGSAMTPEVVKQNLLRFRDGTSPNANYLASLEDVDVQGDDAVILRLSAPDPGLLSYLTRTAGLVASGEAIDAGVDLATQTVGSGPYVLDTRETVTGTSYVYEANPEYWNPEVQHYDEVEINVYNDVAAAVNAIMANEADAVRLADNNNLDQVEGAGWSIASNELDFQGLLLLDRDGTMAPELADVRVRRALNYAFDREALLEALQRGAGSVTTQVFPVTSEAYDPALDDFYSYDPEKARELLAEAGYEDGFTLSMPSSTLLGSATYTFISQQLSEIGIETEYTDPGNNFIADLLAPKFPASFMALEQNPDWQLSQFMVSPGAIFNPFGTEDRAVNALLERMQFGDEVERVEAATELNRYLVEQAWFVPWYRVQGSMAVAPGTHVDMLPTNAIPAIYDIRPETGQE